MTLNADLEPKIHPFSLEQERCGCSELPKRGSEALTHMNNVSGAYGRLEVIVTLLEVAGSLFRETRVLRLYHGITHMGSSWDPEITSSCQDFLNKRLSTRPSCAYCTYHLPMQFPLSLGPSRGLLLIRSPPIDGGQDGQGGLPKPSSTASLLKADAVRERGRTHGDISHLASRPTA